MRYHSNYSRVIKETGQKLKMTLVWCSKCKKRHSLQPVFLLPQKHYRGNEIESVAIDSGTLSAEEIGTDVTGQPDIIVTLHHGLNLAVRHPAPPTIWLPTLALVLLCMDRAAIAVLFLMYAWFQKNHSQNAEILVRFKRKIAMPSGASTFAPDIYVRSPAYFCRSR